MIATSHVIIGGTAGLIIGSITQNPVAALAVGIVSHFVCDIIPHIDHPDAPKIGDDIVFTKKVVIFALIDSLIAFFLTLYLWIEFFNFPSLASPYIWGALGGYLPDFTDNVPVWRFQIRTYPGFKQFHEFHSWVHKLWNVKIPMPQNWLLGSITQVIFVGASIWLSVWYLFS
jgi:hypothetical protein